MKKFYKSTTFLAILTCLIWASSFVPTKVGVNIFPKPLQFAGYTFVLAGLLLIPWTKINRNFFKQIKENFFLFVKVGFFSTTLLYGAYYTGQALADSSIVALIVGCQPVFVSLLAHFILKNEKFNTLKIICLLACIAGMVIVSYPSFSNISTIGWGASIGLGLIVVDCLSAAYGNIIVSQIDFSKVDIKVLNVAELVLGGIMLLIVAYPIEGFGELPKLSADPENYKFYLSLAAMVLINVVSIVIWFDLLARPTTKVSELNTWKFLIPVIGCLQSWIFIGSDNPNVYSIIGLIIIMLSLIIFHKFTDRFV